MVKTVGKGTVILIGLFLLLSIKYANAAVIIPTASITLDGNPSDWSSIDSVCTDAQGDDNTGYTGADIKSFKVPKRAVRYPEPQERCS